MLLHLIGDATGNALASRRIPHALFFLGPAERDVIRNGGLGAWQAHGVAGTQRTDIEEIS